MSCTTLFLDISGQHAPPLLMEGHEAYLMVDRHESARKLANYATSGDLDGYFL
jgi:hypothetical protein